MPVGIGGLEKKGRISSLFVSPGCMRRGIGSALLTRLLEEAESRNMGQLRTEASEFSKALFEKFGFEGRVDIQPSADTRFIVNGGLNQVSDIELIGRLTKIEVHVDIDVVVAREFEDAVDLAVGVRVGIGRRADHGAEPLLDPTERFLRVPVLGDVGKRYDDLRQIEVRCRPLPWPG